MQILIVQQIGAKLTRAIYASIELLITHHVLNIQERVIDSNDCHLILLKSSPHHKTTNTAKSNSRETAQRYIIYIDTASGLGDLPLTIFP